MKQKRVIDLAIALVIVILLLVGCGSASNTQPPSPLPSPKPTLAVTPSTSNIVAEPDKIIKADEVYTFACRQDNVVWYQATVKNWDKSAIQLRSSDKGCGGLTVRLLDHEEVTVGITVTTFFNSKQATKASLLDGDFSIRTTPEVRVEKSYRSDCLEYIADTSTCKFGKEKFHYFATFPLKYATTYVFEMELWKQGSEFHLSLPHWK